MPPLDDSLGAASDCCVVVQESGFAASALRSGAAAGSALAIVVVRPPSVRTSVAKPEIEAVSAEPEPPLLAIILSTSPLLSPFLAAASSVSAWLKRPAAR